jgi:hypothetical protein
MGLFSNKKDKPAEQADEDAGQFNPIHLAAVAITSIGKPAVGLALVIYELLERELVTLDELAKIGISREEVVAIVEAYNDSTSHEEFDYALETQAALRQYNSELADIAGERGVSITSDEYVALRSTIASFAQENDVLDLRVAYRLMLAECPELLPGTFHH